MEALLYALTLCIGLAIVRPMQYRAKKPDTYQMLKGI